MSLVVLGTCTLLWLAGEPERLSPRARETLSQASADLAISSISAWEVAIKVRKGDLELPTPPRTWWNAALDRYRVREMPVTAAIAFASVEEALPHKDPADRIIVATARVLNAQLVTGDRVLVDAVPFAVW